VIQPIYTVRRYVTFIITIIIFILIYRFTEKFYSHKKFYPVYSHRDIWIVCFCWFINYLYKYRVRVTQKLR